METSYFLVRFFFNLTNSWKWKMCIFLHTIKKCHNSWQSSIKTPDVSVSVAADICSPREDLLSSKFLKYQWKFDLSKTSIPNTVCLYDASNFLWCPAEYIAYILNSAILWVLTSQISPGTVKRVSGTMWLALQRAKFPQLMLADSETPPVNSGKSQIASFMKITHCILCFCFSLESITQRIF